MDNNFYIIIGFNIFINSKLRGIHLFQILSRKKLKMYLKVQVLKFNDVFRIYSPTNLILKIYIYKHYSICSYTF